MRRIYTPETLPRIPMVGDLVQHPTLGLLRVSTVWQEIDRYGVSPGLVGFARADDTQQEGTDACTTKAV